MSLAAGQSLSHYTLLGPLGAGAMGEVWRARDTRLDREVAIKVLPAHLAGDDERLRRFEREARSVASLNHPRVAQIHGVDQVGEVCFLVLELVPGESLAARLSRGPLPLAEALLVGAQIADGLEAAHEAGLIHRDLKPANVQLMPDGQVKVLDFGLAKSARDEAGTSYSWAAEGDRVNLFDRDGRLVTTYAQGVPMYSVALSPDARTMAMDVLAPDGFTDIWLYPTAWLPDPLHGDQESAVQQAVLNRPGRHLTFLPGPEFLPVWSPSGDEVVFRWDGDDTRPRGIYRTRITGGADVLVRDNQGSDDHASDWTPDGRHQVVTTDTLLPSPLNGIIAVPLDGGPETPLVTEPGVQRDGHVSPDGRWLAYADAAGAFRTEIRVVPFAPAWPTSEQGRTWLVSEAGGFNPRWSPEGDELFYLTETGLLMSVTVDTSGDSLDYAAPQPLFQTPWRFGRSYDPFPDNSVGPNSFLFLSSDPPTEAPISLLVNWQALLEDG